jgi:hypothetical protein
MRVGGDISSTGREHSTLVRAMKRVNYPVNALSKNRRVSVSRWRVCPCAPLVTSRHANVHVLSRRRCSAEGGARSFCGVRNGVADVHEHRFAEHRFAEHAWRELSVRLADYGRVTSSVYGVHGPDT